MAHHKPSSFLIPLATASIMAGDYVQNSPASRILAAILRHSLQFGLIYNKGNNNESIAINYAAGMTIARNGEIAAAIYCIDVALCFSLLQCGVSSRSYICQRSFFLNARAVQL